MLNIHTRSTKNEHHYVQVPETGSLDDIKEQLGQALKVSPAQVSLIYKGKLLKENQSISSLNLDTEKDFFIFHLKAEAPSSPTPSPSPQPPSAPSFANPASTNNAPPFSPPFASPQGPPSSIPSMTSPPFNPNQGGFGGGIPQRPEPAPISEESINLLVEMGFQKEAVTQALRRANGNPDVAYAILTSPGGAAVVDQGGPEFEGGDDAGGGSDYTPNEDTVQTLVSMGFERNNVVKTLQATRGNADAAYDFLERGEIPPPASADPFVQLRNLLQAHPEHLPQIINQLCASNPQLGAQLRANPAIFLRQLGLDPSQFDLAAVQSGGGGGIPGYNPGYGGGGATGYPAQGGFGVPGQGGVSPGGAGGFGPGMGGYPGGAGGFGPGMGGMPGAGGGMGGFPGGAGGMGGYPGGAGGFGPGMGGMPSGAGGMGGFPGGAGGMGGYPGAQRPAYNPPTVDTSSAEFQEAVTTLTSFGFQREKVITALTQANGNPDIAYAILEQQS